MEILIYRADAQGLRIRDIERPENGTVRRLAGNYSKRQKYLPFTIAASGGCERARMEISRFAARARRGVNVQNEIRFDVYDMLQLQRDGAGRPMD